MTSTEINPTMPTRRLLSGLHVPDFGDDTAPLDVTHLHDEPTPAPKSEPEPTTEQPRPEPSTSSPAPVEVFRPENPTPAPEPVSTSTTTPPPAQPQPQPKPEPQRQPLKPPTAPTFWGSRALEAVYWIAILTGAIGQVIFFGGLFDLGWAGYVAAGIIATTAETIMISAGDTALKFFTNGVPGRRWWIFLAVSIVAALTAAALNVTHWLDKNVSMAVLFGGIALLGYILHVTDGFVRAIAYREAKAAYEAEVQRREAEAAKAAAATTTPEHAPAAPKDKPAAKTATKGKARGKGKAKGNTATKDDAVRVGIEKGATTPAALRTALVDAGYGLPKSQTTLENWCRAIREERSRAQQV